MSNTCPLCRETVGRIEHPQVSISDEQRNRAIAYKIFNMTEDNPELSNLRVVMREQRASYSDRSVRFGWPSHDNMGVYLLIKGFKYIRRELDYGYETMCKIDSEETQHQFDAMKCITPEYDRPKYLILKEDRTTTHFVDSVPTDRSSVPKIGILNAIVRPRCICHNGRNLLHFIAVQVACEKLRDLKPDEIVGL